MNSGYQWFSFVAVVYLLSAFCCGQEKASESLVRIEGLKTVSEQKARTWIEPQFELLNENGVSMARADDLAFFLEDALLDQGYDDALVDWQIAGGKIVLLVNEGQTRDVVSVSIAGNRELTTEAIEELLLTATRDRLNLKSGDTIPYVRNDVAKGKQRIIDLYQLLGYVNIDVEIKEIPGANGTRLQVTVSEGLKHLIEAIEMPDALNSDIAKKFSAIQKSEIGRPLSQSSLARLKAKVRQVMLNQGYYYCEVEVTQQSSHVVAGNIKKIDLAVLLNLGDLVVIDRIEIEGNQKVPNKFFDKQLSDLLKKPYSPQEVSKKIEAILRSGAFTTIRTELVDSSDGSSGLKVYVEEAESRSLGVYGGFATYEGPLVGIEFENRNLFGSARKLDANIEFSRRGLRGEVQYLDPWFLWSDYELRASLFAFNREEEGYERSATGGRYGLTRRFGPEGKDSFSLLGEAVYTEIVNSEIPVNRLGATEYFSHFIGLGLGIDRRDRTFDASRGWVVNGSIGIASDVIGSDINYVKGSLGFSVYQPIGIGTFRFRALAEAIHSLDDEDELPIGLRFFNGGRASVRSFAERELGEFDIQSGNPLGGEFYSVLNAEYVIPIGLVDGLSVIPFVDAGNLLSDANDIGFGNLRYAYGLGLQYDTLIGPFRVDYGFNPDPQKGEDDGALHIGFGSEF